MKVERGTIQRGCRFGEAPSCLDATACLGVRSACHRYRHYSPPEGRSLPIFGDFCLQMSRNATSTARSDYSLSRSVLSFGRNSVSTCQNDLSTARFGVSTDKTGLSTPQNGCSMPRTALSTCQTGLSTAQDDLSSLTTGLPEPSTVRSDPATGRPEATTGHFYCPIAERRASLGPDDVASSWRATLGARVPVAGFVAPGSSSEKGRSIRTIPAARSLRAASFTVSA